MGKIIKGIGSVLSAPARGIGHALGTSGIPLLSNAGNAINSVGNAFAGKGAFLRDIGQAGEQAAPIAGMIPGVGALAGGAMGGLGGLLNRGLNKQGLGEGLKYGGEGALSGLVGSKLFGGKGLPGLFQSGGLNQVGQGASDLFGGFKNLAGKIGKQLPLGLEGGQPFDMGKLAAGAGGIANMIGQGQQRNSAQNYANASIAQRNKLMQMIMGGVNRPDYKMSTYDSSPNLNQQSSATSGGY